MTAIQSKKITSMTNKFKVTVLNRSLIYSQYGSISKRFQEIANTIIFNYETCFSLG